MQVGKYVPVTWVSASQHHHGTTSVTTSSASTSTSASASSSALTISSALFAMIQSPSSFHISAFSAGVVLAANPLVVVATNVLAPAQTTSPSLSTSLPSHRRSSCHP